jgi:hypothetical protein
MAIGDRIPTEIVAPTPLTATAATYYTNTSTNRVQALEIWLCNTGATQRIVALFKNGLVAGNQIANSITLPANTATQIPSHLVLTGTQTLGAKQDVGTDVNIAIYGIVEQIA